MRVKGMATECLVEIDHDTSARTGLVTNTEQVSKRVKMRELATNENKWEDD